MTHVRSTANTMRVLAVVLILSGGSFFLPKTWLESVVVEQGLGQIPQAVLTHYVLLIAGYLLLALGGLLWVVAKDVVRYRRFVIATIAIFLVGAPAFYLINALAGMPTWCGITDFVLCFILGGVLLAAFSWPASKV
jgi:hypothetical protein